MSLFKGKILALLRGSLHEGGVKKNFLMSLMWHALLVIVLLGFAGTGERKAVQGVLSVELLAEESGGGDGEAEALEPEVASIPLRAHEIPQVSDASEEIPAQVSDASLAPQPKKSTAAGTATSPIQSASAGGAVASLGNSTSDGVLPLARDYQQELLRWLLRQQRSLSLRAQHAEALVKIRVEINREGVVQAASVLQNSTVAELDNAALQLVRAASPFPSMPAELAGERFAFIAPIRFQTQR